MRGVAFASACLAVPLLLGLALASCVSEVACHPQDPTRCTARGGATEAAVTTGLAAGAWAAVGCTAQGCAPPFVCNPETKRCERQRCGEAHGNCPAGYHCDPDEQVCR